MTGGMGFGGQVGKWIMIMILIRDRVLMYFYLMTNIFFKLHNY